MGPATPPSPEGNRGFESRLQRLVSGRGGGECLGVLFTPFDLDEAKSIILRAWSSFQRERAVWRVRRKLPPGIGPATEHPQAKHAS